MNHPQDKQSTQIQSLATHYQESYEQVSSLAQQTDLSEVLYFASLAQSKKGSSSKPLRILDLGCAEGELSLELARRGHQVVGVDISEKQLNKLANKAEKESLSIQTIQWDIDQESIPAQLQINPLGSAQPDQKTLALSELQSNALIGSFDLIYFMDIIEHLQNPLAALGRLRSLLRPQGRVLIQTPNAMAIQRLLWYLARPRKHVDYHKPQLLQDLHLSHYDYLSLEKLANFAGLRSRRHYPTRLEIPYLLQAKLSSPSLKPSLVPFNGLKTRWRLLSNLLIKALAKRFPWFADSLLIEFEVCQPIDIPGQIAFWESQQPL